MRLRAPLWLVVSALLLLYGLFFVDGTEAKGRVALIAVGAFGVLAASAAIVHDRIRGRRDQG